MDGRGVRRGGGEARKCDTFRARNAVSQTGDGALEAVACLRSTDRYGSRLAQERKGRISHIKVDYVPIVAAQLFAVYHRRVNKGGLRDSLF